MNKHVIVGTAGHIDHGKTALIKALSGIDTDRLKEEKQRGITIELGFAHLQLPGGDMVGIVDVPGHEKFVRHMVAGAAGIDLVMLIVAADEGVMPQTREHMDICRILSIQKGLVAVTKTDLCDPEWLDMVVEDIRDFVKGTFLDGAPVIPVSSLTGEGTTELMSALDIMVREIQPRSPRGIFRMPVDRVFTMKGFGTVVTGTTTSGNVKVGELVQVYPGKIKTKVRGLQVHNESVQQAEAGCRTAINLQGVEKYQVDHGNTVGHPDQLVPSFILDLRLHQLPSAPRALRNRTRVRFHIGTAEILGRIHLLEGNELKPGDQALAQIRLEKAAVALSRDRFVIRSYSPATTIGGGSIIDPQALKYRRSKKTIKSIIDKLKSLEEGSPDQAVLTALQHNGPAGGTLAGLSRSLNIDEKEVAGILEQLSSSGELHTLGRGPNDPVIHSRVMEEVKNSVVSILKKFHDDNPLKAGLSREELKTKLPKELHPKIVFFLIETMEKEGLITIEGKIARLSDHKVRLDEKQRKLRNGIEESVKRAGLAVPSPAELSRQIQSALTSVLGLLGTLADEGTMIKIHDDIYVHKDNYRKLVSQIEDHFKQNNELTVGDFKNLTGLSRKYSIPILEYFDRHGITLRVGDKRVMKKK